MEQIINYRDIPTDKRLDILNALERIGFFPAYGGVKTMQQIMEKSVPGSGPQFYFVFRENELIGYNFLIGDTKKYKAFPWLAISNMDEQKLAVCEELMKIQIAFFEELGMQKIADHCVRINIVAISNGTKYCEGSPEQVIIPEVLRNVFNVEGRV